MERLTEKRLIDAYKLEELVRSNSARYHHVDDVIAAISRQPTVEAVEVVHGRWNEINQIATGLPWKYRCNECGCPQDYKHNYCPNCGAKMDGGNEDG